MPARGSFDDLAPIINNAMRIKNRHVAKQILKKKDSSLKNFSICLKYLKTTKKKVNMFI